MLAITISFDYRYDTTGFFDDPQRRATLEAAGRHLGERLSNSKLPAIAPSGANSLIASFLNPETGLIASETNLSVGENELLVFVGARDLPGNTWGMASHGNFRSIQGSGSFQSAAQARTDHFPADGFSTWGGWISFDPFVNWHFGLDEGGLQSSPPNVPKADFFTLAVHELGHVLGVGTSSDWATLIETGKFAGEHASAIYGGPVPVDAERVHLLDADPALSVEPVMDQYLPTGRRKLMTALDWAVLDDIGWDVGAPGPATPPKPTIGVTATDRTAKEPGGNWGWLSFARSGSTASKLKVRYTISGTAKNGKDYKELSGQITFLEGDTQTKLAVRALNDRKVEAIETVKITLSATDVYATDPSAKTAKVRIVDNDKPPSKRTPLRMPLFNLFDRIDDTAADPEAESELLLQVLPLPT